MSNRQTFSSLLIMMAWCVSCGTESYPPITDAPTYSYRYNEFVWHELGTADVDRAQDFYGKLFNWKFTSYNSGDTPYLLIRNEGKPIGGIIKVEEGNANTWVGALSVEDTEAKVEEALREGGDVLIKETRVNGRGTMALIRDPQGALFSLIHSSSGDPALTMVNSREWLWMELWSNKPTESSNYYSAITDFTVDQREIDEKPYWVFSTNTQRIAGMIRNPIDNMTTQWVPYIKVSSAVNTAEKAKSLGGNVLLEPREDIRKGSVAVLLDPDGAVFCVQEWPVK